MSYALEAAWIRNGLSYLQLQPPNKLFVSSHRDAGLGYSVHRGFALVPGPPIGPPESWTRLVGDFEQHCRELHLKIAFCGLARFGQVLMTGLGYRTVKVGDEAVVHLDSITLRGRGWRECRAALNRAARRGVTFSWLRSEQRGPELSAVSQRWLAAKPLPEMAFGLGTQQSLSDAGTRVAAARDGTGALLGFVTWVPVPQQGGWMLDLMRQQPGAMAGLMDFLIIRSLLDLRDEGCGWASLGGVPLSNVGRERGGFLRTLMDFAFRRGHDAYRPSSLFHFKSKFNPVWQPLYVACAPGTSLAVALVVIASATFSTAGTLRALLDVLF